MEKPWKICVMKIKDNSNIYIIYKFEIVRLCYKKVIQDFLAVRPVIFIGGTVPVVRSSLYPFVGFQRNRTVPICRVFCTHMLGILYPYVGYFVPICWVICNQPLCF